MLPIFFSEYVRTLGFSISNDDVTIPRSMNLHNFELRPEAIPLWCYTILTDCFYTKLKTSKINSAILRGHNTPNEFPL